MGAITDKDRQLRRAQNKERHLKRLQEEFKKIPPREFISFDVLKSHLPVMLCPSNGDNDDLAEKQVNSLMDEIALELIEAYPGSRV